MCFLPRTPCLDIKKIANHGLENPIVARLQFLNPEGEFYRRCFYHALDSDLRTGRAMSVLNNEKIVSLAEAHRMVARARVQGWLPP
jgi:hypothetical protein